MNCKYCDNPVPDGATTCPSCGAPAPAPRPQPQPQPVYQQAVYQQPVYQQPAKSRAAYIILGIFVGLLGIHNFYAGRTTVGVIQLLITLLLGWVGLGVVIVSFWVFIEFFAVRTDGHGVPMA